MHGAFLQVRCSPQPQRGTVAFPFDKGRSGVRGSSRARRQPLLSKEETWASGLVFASAHPSLVAGSGTNSPAYPFKGHQSPSWEEHFIFPDEQGQKLCVV